RARGLRVTFSHATYAGVTSTCVALTATTGTSTWCAADDTGVMTHWSDGGYSFSLTSYSSTPSPATFALPAGSTVVTIAP
ncbi:MAG TPA: hypothetical protein VFN54_06735, partial [Acidimicrobiales bacterium]|nr:hypothetical protein [Acidimicrobiales bacterium]